jgi:hypothetical protein
VINLEGLSPWSAAEIELHPNFFTGDRLTGAELTQLGGGERARPRCSTHAGPSLPV